MLSIKESGRPLLKIIQNDKDLIVEIDSRQYNVFYTIKTNEALIALLIMKNIITQEEINDYLDSIKVMEKLTE